MMNPGIYAQNSMSNFTCTTNVVDQKEVTHCVRDEIPGEGIFLCILLLSMGLLLVWFFWKMRKDDKEFDEYWEERQKKSDAEWERIRKM